MSAHRQPWVPACVITVSRWVRLFPNCPASVQGTCDAPINPACVSRAVTHLGLATHSGGFAAASATP